jgi:hypothetical protein
MVVAPENFGTALVVPPLVVTVCAAAPITKKEMHRHVIYEQTF